MNLKGENMKDFDQSYRLILAGNTNVYAMINAIISATLQVRNDTRSDQVTFRQIHLLHTEESLSSLIGSATDWRTALANFQIPTSSLIHHVTKLEDSSIERFRDLVEQLRTIVNPHDNAIYYVDLTGGISALKTILAVFAYVLDIERIYSLEIKFSLNDEVSKVQKKLFLHELNKRGDVTIDYKRFPPIREFDDFGRLSLTEIVRHRRIVEQLTDNLSNLLPTNFDLSHLRESLISGTTSRLLGEQTGTNYDFRHSVFSFSSAVEEMTNIILTFLTNSEFEEDTLGDKLEKLRQLFSGAPKYFVNVEVLKHLTMLIKEVRNNVVHPSLENSDKLEALQSSLSAQLTDTFIRFAVKTLSAFLDQEGNLVDLEVLDPIDDPKDETIYYYGFDGDSTGDYLEVGFTRTENAEAEVLKRSQSVHKAIKEIGSAIKKKAKDSSAVIFAEGDNVLFKMPQDYLFILQIQEIYKKHTGLCSSVGYGKTLNEATIAMRLAKAKRGDTIIGITFKESPSNEQSEKPKI